jgi:hypothetical protein
MDDAWAESIELHERAHLGEAYLPELVGRLMALMPPPAAGGIAAASSGQHFAEMAGEAWSLVTPPGDFCVDGSLAERLRATEARVPGTAGFVVWYLRHPALRALDGNAELAAAADLSSIRVAPSGARWGRRSTPVVWRTGPIGRGRVPRCAPCSSRSGSRRGPLAV